jgi:hypothetical protein
LEELLERFNANVHAYVVMSNHLLLKANDANLQDHAMVWHQLYSQNQGMPPIETLFQSDSGGEFNIGKNH